MTKQLILLYPSGPGGPPLFLWTDPENDPQPPAWLLLVAILVGLGLAWVLA